MSIEDLCQMYEDKRKLYGSSAYAHVSALLKEAKSVHKRQFTGRDHEQSWRAWKGKNLEKLIRYIIEQEVENIGLSIVEGNTLSRSKAERLSRKLGQVKRNLLVDYGEYGAHLLDVDIVLYSPLDCCVVALLSVKVTLRERIAQTAYWKLKLYADKLTRHIKLYLITLDEDGTLQQARPAKKGRAIVETDTDGSYVLCDKGLEWSDKVKSFADFLKDIRKLLQTNYSVS